VSAIDRERIGRWGIKSIHTSPIVICGETVFTHINHHLYFAAMKQQLLLTLFSAIAHSSLGALSCEYDIFCEVGGDRKSDDCHFAIPDTGDPQTGENEITLNHLVRDVLHNCVREGTDDNVDFQMFEAAPEGERRLRVKAVPEERLLARNPCRACCCSQPACMIQGVCGSSNSCGTQSCNRRLQNETETYTTASDTTGYLQSVEEAFTSGEDPELSSLCTQSVRALATLFGWNNKCLGADPSMVECAVTKHCLPYE
jgi:hypothetical protein